MKVVQKETQKTLVTCILDSVVVYVHLVRKECKKFSDFYAIGTNLLIVWIFLFVQFLFEEIK